MTKVDTSESGPDGRRARLWNEIHTYERRIVSLGKEIKMLNESIGIRKRELAAMDRHPSTTQRLENDGSDIDESLPDVERPCS